MNRVAIEHCQDYSRIKEAVDRIVSCTAFPDCQGRTILVKPNILSDSRPEAGITTHPALVKEVVALCFERGAKKVYVGDSPGLHNPGFRGQNCGMDEVCRQTGAQWADFSKSPQSVLFASSERVKVASVLNEVDFTISVSKFKTHQLMYSTGPVKNVFGLMPGLNKSPMHLRHPSREDFAAFIVELFKVSKVVYSFIDAVIGMEGSGPANGTLRHVGLLFGGADAFLVDRAQALVMGYDEADIPILNAARLAGLMPERPDYPILDPADIVIPDFRRISVERPKGLFSSLILPFFTRSRDRRKTARRPAPQFDNSRCIHCRRCVQICPAGALRHDGQITVDTSKCIRCYCCAEMCPADAIRVEEN